ncbi:adenosine deaminase [Leifsonia sp. 21MFCrub1.1]|uniref:adenosine deaminase n=1 Tax=Leifsonia sp. 21MFCrub1.1 TaxID=1798223 RepID=UPI0008928726|nr:adenosine deaminase [Leifsonia sp. 21MFCrub1.1]SEB08233.1 adenosine deaminase [Leifsonia sp. 21MFCrub1.1]
MPADAVASTLPATRAAGPARRIDETWIRALPKAETHVHLEGNFELVDLLDLAKAAGERLPGPAATLFDVSTHDASDGSGDLADFLRFLDWECGLVRTAEQAARHAYTFAARQTASGIGYTDAIINPTHWGAWAGRVPELFDALAAGLEQAEQDGLAEVRLCYSLLRQQSASEAREVVEWLRDARPRRVVALSIDGDERSAGRVSGRFAEAFSLAKEAGFRRTVHAGESSGPEGVWDAIQLLHAERIDHGVRAVEDPELLRYLADTQIPLGVCPRSNVVLGIYDDWRDHPLVALRDAGVNVTINTDDPAPLGTTLEADWAVCAETFGLDQDDLVGFARASIAASFADDATKARLEAGLRPSALSR